PVTQMGYEDYPQAIGNVLRKVAKEFTGELIVTENGYTYRREDVFTMDLAALQHDIDRELYIREHLRSCARAPPAIPFSPVILPPPCLSDG
ncbi:MAG: family 1 glycosylhydrolase, partial [Clostridia bacterium]|nr:family 1 glycosylhydrolase [Clostridia bacterium]